jgi:tRNA pseudouridine38-40 synthase
MASAETTGQRIAVGIEYDGSRYVGWQRQPEAPSVQAEIERALGTVADHPVGVTCGGRTDAGVHALGQVAHFDTVADRPLRGWTLGANTALPTDIVILWAAMVPGDFHARYSALSRSYRYVIQNRMVRPALARQRACWIHEALDEAAMNDAAQHLLGEHDFSAFRAAECQSRSPVRRVERISVARSGDLVTIEITANAFLHHMVRNIAGTLITVGRGEQPPAWVARTLAGRDRRSAGITAPAGGLYFLNIEYPRRFGLPAADAGASAMIAGA